MMYSEEKDGRGEQEIHYGDVVCVTGVSEEEREEAGKESI